MSDESAERAVEELVLADIDGLGPAHVASFVLVAEVHEAEGTRRHYSLTLTGQTGTTTLGLLSAATAIEQERTVRWFFDDE